MSVRNGHCWQPSCQQFCRFFTVRFLTVLALQTFLQYPASESWYSHHYLSLWLSSHYVCCWMFVGLTHQIPDKLSTWTSGVSGAELMLSITHCLFRFTRIWSTLPNDVSSEIVLNLFSFSRKLRECLYTYH